MGRNAGEQLFLKTNCALLLEPALRMQNSISSINREDDWGYRHQTATLAQLLATCMCWAHPCCHKNILAFPHPTLPLCLLLFKAMPKGGTPCCRQWLSRALHPPGQWLLCCTGQQQNPASFPRGCRLLSVLARIQIAMGTFAL